MVKRLASGLVLWLLCGLAYAACSGSGTSWSCTSGSTVANVQSAVNSATDGATITLASGSYTWTSGTVTLSNTKGVTIQGAGAGSTVITVGTNTFIGMDALDGDNTKLYRITGITFQNGNGSLGIWFYGYGNTATMHNCRIDNNEFKNFTGDAIAIFLGEQTSANKFKCVIDNNTFTGASENFMVMKYLGPGADSWSSSLLGTANNVFLEGNTINFTTNTNLGSGCIDVWAGGAVVFRYNDSTNCLWTAHGVSHGATVNFEAYGNAFRRTSSSGGLEDGTRLVHHQGSGTMMIFDNVWHVIGTISSGALAVTHYRSATPANAGYDVGLDMCDGASTGLTDGNTLSNGWPCWMQPGRAPAGGSPAYGTLSPIYIWNNTNNANGAIVSLVVEDPWDDGAPTVQDHVVSDRDYYNAVSASAQSSATSPFNGTTGMGFGTLANRPTTCTTGTYSGGGVGYYATDIDTLYRCSASNTWTVHYRPYVYPHPLVSGKPAPPMNPRTQ